MRCWVFVVAAVVSCSSSGLGMVPYGAGRGSGADDQGVSGSALTSATTGLSQGSIPSILGVGIQTGSRLTTAGSTSSSSGFQTAGRPAPSSGGSFAASGDSAFQTAGRPAGSTAGSFAASGDSGFQTAGRPAGSTAGSFAASGDSGFQSAGSGDDSFAISGDSSFQSARRPASGAGFFPASGDRGFQTAGRPAGSSAGSFAGSGDNLFPSFGRPAGRQDATFPDGSAFTSSIIKGQPTLTVTQTVTRNSFTTLTDTVFNTFAVTQTQFVLQTTTRLINQVIATPVDDFYAITTTVVHRPTFVTVTETRSDFRLFLRTSVTHITLTHTSYAITHVPFTITATETVQITSQMVKTVITTHRQLVTDYRTLVNTIYVHGGYL